MNDDYIPLERFKYAGVPTRPHGLWSGVGNRALEMPDCPPNARECLESGGYVLVPSMSAVYRKRKC